MSNVILDGASVVNVNLTWEWYMQIIDVFKSVRGECTVHISVPLVNSEMQTSPFKLLFFLHFLQVLFNGDEASIAVKEVTFH